MAENRLTVPTNPARALRDLNRQAPITPQERDTDEEQDIQNNTTILQSDKPTDRPTNGQTNQQSDQLTHNQTVKVTDKPTSRLTSQPTDKPTRRQTGKAATKPSSEPAPVERRPRVDGRTSRPRQETADRTMVTSMRLAVETLEALDEYCYHHRQRKQDVVQAALDMYFAAEDAEEN